MKHEKTFDECLFLKGTAAALLCAAALTSPAATVANWTGGASGTWGAGYEGNWSVYPDADHYAVFGEPKTEPITVQVEGNVEAYGVMSDTGRTAGLNFTGTGTFTNKRGTLFEQKGSASLTDWDIDVASTVNTTAIQGINCFHKKLDCSAVYNFTLQSNSKVTLSDSARMTGQHVIVQPGATFECLGSSVVSITKDFKPDPGASFKISTNAVITSRGLTMPFSREAGVNDSWTLDGGTLCVTNSGGFNAAGYSAYLPYTNSTKTVSGTGKILLLKLDLSHATNSTFRLDGPDLYVKAVGGQYTWNNVLDVRGGSTIGAYGADVNLANNWYTKFSGSAAIDTTDYADKMTPRTITLTRLQASSGDLAVKGAGNLRLGISMTNPNLNLAVSDSATFNTQSNALYAIGDIVLKDSASFVSDYYIGHKGSTDNTKSLTMSGDTTLRVARYAQISGDVALSGNAAADI